MDVDTADDQKNDQNRKTKIPLHDALLCMKND
jgi:hypothetical protein